MKNLFIVAAAICNGVNMHSRIFVAIICCTALLVSGCAGFKARNLPEVKQEDLRFTNTSKTKIFSRWSTNINSTADQQSKTSIAAINKEYFEAATSRSACCIVVEDPREADIVVTGTVHDENSSAALFPAALTGASLYMIPSWVTSKVHISVEAKSGDVSRLYDLDDSMTMVQWLPMILAFPFSNPFTAEKQTIENVYNTLVLRMKNDGLLK